MPTEGFEKIKGTFYIENKNGEVKELEISNIMQEEIIPTFTDGGFIDNPEEFGGGKEVSFNAVLKTFSRKRFKKLLMGYGYSRNVAEILTKKAKSRDSFNLAILVMLGGDIRNRRI